MAVAVHNTPDTATRPVGSSLAAASLTGSAYVLAAVAAVAIGVPALWSAGLAVWVRENLGQFVNVAGLIVVELFAVGVLWMLGLAMAGGAARPGLRAGIFTAVAITVVTAVVVSVVGWYGATPVSDSFAAAIGAVMVIAAWRFFADARFPDWMQTFEAQGWFTAASYKPNQGRRVRRATMLGLLVLAACGVWTLMNHHTLDAAGDWKLRVPFAGTIFTLLPDVKFTLPLLLAAISFWLSYRVVHMPTFAEFLIATEGELNKVAWPTRRSLLQDTLVVLTTVILMTLFLFAVDVAWGKILSSRFVDVLKIDADQKTPAQSQETKELDW